MHTHTHTHTPLPHTYTYTCNVYNDACIHLYGDTHMHRDIHMHTHSNSKNTRLFRVSAHAQIPCVFVSVYIELYGHIPCTRAGDVQKNTPTNGTHIFTHTHTHISSSHNSFIGACRSSTMRNSIHVRALVQVAYLLPYMSSSGHNRMMKSFICAFGQRGSTLCRNSSNVMSPEPSASMMLKNPWTWLDRYSMLRSWICIIVRQKATRCVTGTWKNISTSVCELK